MALKCSLRAETWDGNSKDVTSHLPPSSGPYQSVGVKTTPTLASLWFSYWAVGSCWSCSLPFTDYGSYHITASSSLASLIAMLCWKFKKFEILKPRKERVNYCTYSSYIVTVFPFLQRLL